MREQMQFENIPDRDGYVLRMNAALQEKLWFLSFIDPEITTILDYGCGDGALLAAMSSDKYQVIGYDKCSDMVARAQARGITAFSNWDMVTDYLKQQNIQTRKTALVMSSVLHEIFSYETEDAAAMELQTVLNAGFGQVFLRDMMFQDSAYLMGSREDATKIYQHAESDPAEQRRIEEFETLYGKLSCTRANVLHYLLKCKYIKNWEREVRENYSPLRLQELHQLVGRQYVVQCEQKEILPFAAAYAKRDYGITLTDTTHIKLALRMKE